MTGRDSLGGTVMTLLSRRSLMRLAPLGWFVGALVVVVVTVLAMRQGVQSRLARAEGPPLRAASATLQHDRAPGRD